MKIEKYECDRCKKVLETKEEVLELRASLVVGYPTVQKVVHVCLPCGEKLELRKPKEKDEAKKMSENLLDIIFDIVEEVVSNR